MKLTVIFRNEMPFIIFQEPYTYRSVQIELTEEQLSKLEKKKVGESRGKEVYEEIRQVFLEE